MKLFQQLLVAPAALGLLAPMAATAAELNINDVSGYTDSVEEATGMSQFSDVYPTDWAYQALTSLAERHGCVAAAPEGSMTRYEAAALLNKCLGNVAQVNDEERRLLNEFGPELAVIKGRLDGLEARVGEFEAGQFSSTTKLSGKYNFVVGGYHRDGGATDQATTFSYSTQFDLNTSFSGDDLMYTRIKAGNTAAPFNSTTYGTYLASAHSTSADLKIDKIWYTFPVGDSFNVWVGPRIENYYMLASAPSIYKPVLKQFALGGNSAAYASSTDGGFGASWTQQVDDRSQPRFAVSTNYASKGASSAAEDGGGILSDSKAKWLTKLEYGSPRWQVSFALSTEYCNEPASGSATESCNTWYNYYATKEGRAAGTGNSTSYSARAYWKPEESGVIPSVQVGYDVRDIDDDNGDNSLEQTTSWMVGLMWDDAFIDGNRVGFAFGQRAYASEKQCNASAASQVVCASTSGIDNADDNFVWEAYYDFKVSDSITVTPAIFGGTDTYDGNVDDSDDIFGGLVQTTFRF